MIVLGRASLNKLSPYEFALNFLSVLVPKVAAPNEQKLYLLPNTHEEFHELSGTDAHITRNFPNGYTSVFHNQFLHCSNIFIFNCSFWSVAVLIVFQAHSTVFKSVNPMVDSTFQFSRLPKNGLQALNNFECFNTFFPK